MNKNILEIIFDKNLEIKAEINISSSKSISNRILIIRQLTKSKFEIQNLSDSDDTNILAYSLDSLFSNKTIDVGAAGTSFRFLTAFLCTLQADWILTGSSRMKQRPINKLVNALKQLGASIEYLEKEDFPPIKILASKIKGGEIEIDSNISSQFISALLMIAPTLEDGLTLKLKDEIVSIPYIQMTLDIMSGFGINYIWKNNIIKIEKQEYQAIQNYTVEGDWSSASYIYEIAAISDKAEIIINNLRKNSLQGDSVVADIFDNLGVKTIFGENRIIIKKEQNSYKLDKNKVWEYNFANCPDLAQTVAISCLANEQHFRFSGLETLRWKETDRIAAIVNEANKIGYIIENIDNKIMEFTGKKTEITSNCIETYHDHRMAMAFAPLAVKFGKINIANPDVVSKSYKNYWEDMLKIGCNFK